MALHAPGLAATGGLCARPCARELDQRKPFYGKGGIYPGPALRGRGRTIPDDVGEGVRPALRPGAEGLRRSDSGGAKYKQWIRLSVEYVRAVPKHWQGQYRIRPRGDGGLELAKRGYSRHRQFYAGENNEPAEIRTLQKGVKRGDAMTCLWLAMIYDHRGDTAARDSAIKTAVEKGPISQSPNEQSEVLEIKLAR